MTPRWTAPAVRRVAYALTIIFVATVVVFVLLRLAPGDPTTMLLGANFASASPERIAKLREFYGLDQPFVIQFVLYVRSLISLDLGNSVQSGQAVTQIILDKAPYTLLLALTAGVFTYAVSIPLGVLAAVRKDSWIDRVAMGISALGLGVPTFALAIVLVWLLGLQTRLLPISGSTELRHLILPTIVLSAEAIAVTIRQVRSSMLDQINQDYVRTLRAAGISERRIIWTHALRNALPPVVAFSAVQLRAFVGYALIVEIIFRWPGLGSTLVNSILGRDYAVAQFLAILLTIVVIVFSQLADLLARRLDPRLRDRAAI
jgi:ABC-type dipeptide/oligopeptide/nickel transport system permease component